MTQIEPAGRLFVFLDYQFPNNSWIIANYTVASHLSCALFCNRKENCVGFNYRQKTSVNTDNCQLTNCPLKADIQGYYDDDLSWAFFQAPYPILVSY